MKPFYPQKTCSLLGLLVVLPLTLTGCQQGPTMDGGPEVRFLISAPPPAPRLDQPLLPLTAGATWNMVMDAKGLPKVEGRVASVSPAGESLIEFRKNGVLWRREAYRNTADGLFLTAMGEDQKPLMRLSPAIPIVRYPVHEGAAESWTGTFQYGTTSYQATAFSRVSALEKIKNPFSKAVLNRVDTLVTINQNGRLVKFPTIRWMAPGVGFIRHSFIDEGRNYAVDLQKFTPGR